MSHKMMACFICWKTRIAIDSIFGDDGGGDGGLLYSKFVNFTRNYLQTPGDPISDGDDDKLTISHSPVVEVNGFCEECSTKVAQIVELYVELCSVEVRLCSKLEEVGELIKTSQMLSELSSKFQGQGLDRICKVDEFRKLILDKCKFQCGVNFVSCIMVDSC